MAAQPQEKPDLSQPVKITGLNEGLAFIDKQSRQALKASGIFGKLTVAGAGVTGGLLLASISPVMTGVFTVFMAAGAIHEHARGSAYREIRRELGFHSSLYQDGPRKNKALSILDLEKPVQVNGLSKAVAMIDKKANKSFKSAKRWRNAVFGGAALTLAVASVGMSPAVIFAATVAAAAVGMHKSLKGRTMRGLAKQFNEAAQPGGKPPAMQAARAAAPPKQKNKFKI